MAICAVSILYVVALVVSPTFTAAYPGGTNYFGAGASGTVRLL